MNTNCYMCGKVGHKAAQCLFRTSRCHNHGKTGHIRRVYRQPKKPPRHPRQQESKTSEILVLYHDKAGSDKPLEMDLKLDGKPLRMEVGATVSLLSEKTYQSLFPMVQLLPLLTMLSSHLTNLKVLPLQQ